MSYHSRLNRQDEQESLMVDREGELLSHQQGARSSSLDQLGRLGMHSQQPSYSSYGTDALKHRDDDDQDTQASSGASTPPRRAAGAAAAARSSGVDRAAATNFDNEKQLQQQHQTEGGWWSRKSSKAKRWLLLLLLLIIIVIAVIVAVPTAVTQSRKQDNSQLAAGQAGDAASQQTKSASSTSASRTSNRASSAAPSSTTPSVPNPSGRPASGYDGSTVYAMDGTTFVYNNSFGGFWNSVPFNDSARAQSWSPALNEEWNYDTDIIRGVNVGGWLTIEPFIAPQLFEPFNPQGDGNYDATVIDEWTLCEALGSNLSTVLTNHYETFITEKDFAEIAAAGLNWVRVPIPYWIIETQEGEPFLANVGWQYFLRSIAWARKYGLRINLDLHATPGSQNGYNHSSKQGMINFLNGVMGIANAQRTLEIIRTITQFISQPEYKNVVPMFSIMNEPYGPTIGIDTLRHFYLETYNMMRGMTGFGKDNGPWIAFHDGFPLQNGIPDSEFDVSAGGWLGWLPGMDRVSLDTHPYLCFSEPNNDGLAYQASKPCTYWAEKMNLTTAQFGLSIAAEWSLAVNDCGKWLNNVGNGQRYAGTYITPGTSTRPFEGVGSCEEWTNYPAWTDERKQGLMQVAMAHMDAFRHFFFWTWKIGTSIETGLVPNPFWSYQLGLEQGWVPRDPRTALGVCPGLVARAGTNMNSFAAPPLSAWMTGGAGAGTMLNTAMEAAYTQWPPSSLGTTPVSNLPTLTPTGTRQTMPALTQTSLPVGYTAVPSVGDSWAYPNDSRGAYVKVEGCDYPDAWSAVTASVPTAPCGGSGSGQRFVKRRAAPLAEPTPAPRML
ncbi:hypothetical protein OIO90_006310 [Microbotryomycetes sp. JL221]|nr:hypothetical protein OIO90_006310 [Microbotryomycetes sp. JL221]